VARDAIEGSILTETGWFNAGMLQKALADHKAGLADHGRLLWQIVMLEKSLKRLFG
jgi:asparagine synthase (glutamine-hydrolysing)